MPLASKTIWETELGTARSSEQDAAREQLKEWFVTVGQLNEATAEKATEVITSMPDKFMEMLEIINVSTITEADADNKKDFLEEIRELSEPSYVV